MSYPLPDFSGEWILNRQACSLSPGADAIQTAVVKIEHRDPKFRYKARFVSEGDPVEFEYELLSDGREVVATHEGTTTISSLRWDGGAIIASWHIQRTGSDLRISFRHELENAGRRLRAVEELRGDGRHQDNIWIFDRQ
jgi:hypothetical protein